MHMAPLLERLRAHLDRARLFPAPGPAVLAVSGGLDSVALLDLMHSVAPERGLLLVVAHADHGIQMESGKVGRMVRRLAATYAVPFELGELNLGPEATETAAGRARYAWLTEVQRRHAARCLVTAHHADDQVETILLRVLKGSGPAGLAGMPARGRGGIVRPLLPFSRAELAVHVAERGLAFHDDPANRDPRRSEEHTSELQSQSNLVCRLLLEKKKDTESRHNPSASCRPNSFSPRISTIESHMKP